MSIFKKIMQTKSGNGAIGYRQILP